MAGIAAHLPKSSRGPVARNSARTGHAEESTRGSTRRGAARRISPGCVSCFSRRPTRSSLASPTKIRALSLSPSRRPPSVTGSRLDTRSTSFRLAPVDGKGMREAGGRSKGTERVRAPYVCASVGEKATTNEYAARRTREKRPIIRCPSAERKWLRFARHVRRGERRGERDSVWGERVTRARAARATSRGNERAVRVSASD